MPYCLPRLKVRHSGAMVAPPPTPACLVLSLNPAVSLSLYLICVQSHHQAKQHHLLGPLERNSPVLRIYPGWDNFIYFRPISKASWCIVLAVCIGNQILLGLVHLLASKKSRTRALSHFSPVFQRIQLFRPEDSVLGRSAVAKPRNTCGPAADSETI